VNSVTHTYDIIVKEVFILRKCYVCLEELPFDDWAKSYPLDNIDREILHLGPVKKMLYFHPYHYKGWLKIHIKRRKRYIERN